MKKIFTYIFILVISGTIFITPGMCSATSLTIDEAVDSGISQLSIDVQKCFHEILSSSVVEIDSVAKSEEFSKRLSELALTELSGDSVRNNAYLQQIAEAIELLKELTI